MKLKLISNPRKLWAKALAREAALLLKRAGHSIVQHGADATVCIGGDGTILYANNQKRLEGTVLGIGSIKSYICQLRRQSWKNKLARLLARKKTVRIMTLDAHVGRKHYSDERLRRPCDAFPRRGTRRGDLVRSRAQARFLRGRRHHRFHAAGLGGLRLLGRRY
jgi:NAD kinase